MPGRVVGRFDVTLLDLAARAAPAVFATFREEYDDGPGSRSVELRMALAGLWLAVATAVAVVAVLVAMLADLSTDRVFALASTALVAAPLAVAIVHTFPSRSRPSRSSRRHARRSFDPAMSFLLVFALTFFGVWVTFH